MFYPGDPAELAREIEDLLGGLDVGTGQVPKVVIAPHAGYRYSGPAAATAWACLAPAADRIRRVVLLGPAHRMWVRGVAHPGVDELDTPLGSVLVDSAALARAAVPADREAHAREHSLEVHLPFLQRTLPDARVVPLVVGDATAEEVAAVLDALWGGDETVIVVSSDLSHYLPYEDGRRRDEVTAQRIVALDSRPLNGDDACGCRAINGLLRVARRRGMTARQLALCSSGDTAGPRDQVVGYGAFAFYDTPRPN